MQRRCHNSALGGHNLNIAFCWILKRSEWSILLQLYKLWHFIYIYIYILQHFNNNKTLAIPFAPYLHHCVEVGYLFHETFLIVATKMLTSRSKCGI